MITADTFVASAHSRDVELTTALGTGSEEELAFYDDLRRRTGE